MPARISAPHKVASTPSSATILLANTSGLRVGVASTSWSHLKPRSRHTSSPAYSAEMMTKNSAEPVMTSTIA
ncbi:hypothetical protein [Nannocystis pusilla]|uniref:hypothetical protein n=1 Tax=Nannocystis pusilla TaxID=889268 RepID=UPI003DA48EB6